MGQQNGNVALDFSYVVLRMKNLVEENKRLKEELIKLQNEYQIAMTDLEQYKKEILKREERRCYKEKIRTSSEYKTNGVLKARPADSIRSYDDFVTIRDYFAERNEVRNETIWVVGICLGYRGGDLTKLKFRNFYNTDLTKRSRICVVEQKTNKLNNCIISDAIMDQLEKLIIYMGGKDKIELDDYIFCSNRGTPLSVKRLWSILNNACVCTGLPIHLSTHSLRKSFANIVACVDKNVIDMNTVEKVRGLLNHSDPRITMRYLGTLTDMYDRARMVVSDFVLGQTGVNELVAGEYNDSLDIYEQLQEIKEKLEELS